MWSERNWAGVPKTKVEVQSHAPVPFTHSISRGGSAIQCSISVRACVDNLPQQALQNVRLRATTIRRASATSDPVSHFVMSLMHGKVMLGNPGGAKCILDLGTFLTAQFQE